MAQKLVTAEDVTAILSLPGWNQIRLAERMGVTQSTVSRWTKGAKMSADHQAAFFLICDEIESSGDSLATRGWRGMTVPVVGYVGAGWTVIVFDGDQGEFERVQAPPDVTESTVAVRVRGESLGPFFDRWVVFYDEVRRPLTSDLYDEVCVVGLSSGSVVIKKVTKGQRDGCFNLLSQFEPPIYDAEVEWAAKVKWMGPA